MIRLFKYEFIRMTSVRSTWVITILGTLMIGLLVSLSLSNWGGSDVYSETGITFYEFAPFVAPVWSIWASAIAAQAFGHDFRHGTIRLTLSTFPNRMKVYFVRASAVLIWCAVWLLLIFAIVIAMVTAQESIVGGFNFPGSVDSFGRVAVYAMLYVLSALAIVMITRILALGVVVPLILASVAENIYSVLAPESLRWTIEYLPYSRALIWSMSMDVPMANETAIPLAVLTVALLTIAGFMFIKRDA